MNSELQHNHYCAYLRGETPFTYTADSYPPTCGVLPGVIHKDWPVFYEGTLTGQRYLELLHVVVTDFDENLPLHQLRNVWFQHDATPPHKISNVKQYLMETFQNQVIGYGGFVERLPSSPDFTPLDFYLWGHIKGQVYATLRQHCRIFDDALLMPVPP
ncbi:hypothetical protein AVEN_232108-1 [Araneus ventricosus]|uniref:Tc1-like transposase DDE domain-containing protein n=1 Tax=Araneus ventricosus TaxID=182803 RepID=A0A4Y2FUR8_ARAVE|nr:hypothetical protein AVEN_232108-1 [Araneus ventricosus]